MKLAKDRIQRNDNGTAALFVLYTITFESLKMLSVFSPFLCDYLYRRFFMKYEKETSLFMHTLESVDSSVCNIALEKQMGLVRELSTVALTARQDAGIKLRWPIRSMVIETKSHEVIDSITVFQDMLCRLLNVKEVKTSDAKPNGEFVSQNFSMGTIYVDKKMDESLYEEGILNEVKRRIQSMRKESGLVEKDQISITLDGDKELVSLILKQEAALKAAVNSVSMDVAVAASMKEFDIDGRRIRISIKKK